MKGFSPESCGERHLLTSVKFFRQLGHVQRYKINKNIVKYNQTCLLSVINITKKKNNNFGQYTF